MHNLELYITKRPLYGYVKPGTLELHLSHGNINLVPVTIFINKDHAFLYAEEEGLEIIWE